MRYTCKGTSYPVYDPDKGAGFLQSIPEDMANYPERYGGVIAQSTESLPLLFLADMEPGTYRISVHLRGSSRLFAQRRRLYAAFQGEGEHAITFVTMVADVISDYDKKRYPNNRIALVFTGNPEILSIEITACAVPVVWLAGDSTVADQNGILPYDPGLSYCGWGQMLSMFFPEDRALFNLARSGLTTDTFRSQGHYDVMYERLKAGDYVFIQFGHNDQKVPELLPEGRYLDNLLRYLEELRGKQAVPVLVTPLARNSWNCSNGNYNDLLLEYAGAVREAARKAGCLLLDLHRISKEYIIAKGLEGAKPYFYPGDYTHTNDYGGYLVAKMIWQETVENPALGEIGRLLLPPESDPGMEMEAWAGWLYPPNPSSPDCQGVRAITALEALQYVQKAYKYFAVNPLGSEPEAVTAARQNGYLVDSLTEPDRPISWREWAELLVLACQGRNGSFQVPEYNARPEALVDWQTGVKYASWLEQTASGCPETEPDGMTIPVAGS